MRSKDMRLIDADELKKQIISEFGYHIEAGILEMIDSQKVVNFSDPMTNDEWRKTCPTEEFAEFLNFIAFDWNRVDKQWVLEWLKQPHAQQKQDDYPCNVKGCSLETRQSCCGCPDYFKWKENQESR